MMLECLNDKKGNVIQMLLNLLEHHHGLQENFSRPDDNRLERWGI
jgi:hypothetical protein